jgi:hypothetical protein
MISCYTPCSDIAENRASTYVSIETWRDRGGRFRLYRKVRHITRLNSDRGTTGTFAPSSKPKPFYVDDGVCDVQYAQRRDDAQDAVRVPNGLEAAHANASLAVIGKCSLPVCYLFQAIIYGLMFRGPKLVFTRPQTAVDEQSISAMREPFKSEGLLKRRTGVLLSVSIGRRYRRPGFGS